ncbi:gamma-glutamylcyclotransferase family protein [Shivajiella indica]|uniref:Gamma-glutamylcyclotransferase family protein n=1 Tax=Shivajiella indica TaxID=872115 RepID=A0ABW5B6C3_9BACT
MDKFYYFGYASNLHTETLEGRLRNPPRKIGLGVLPHFGFRFNFPNSDGSARANIVPSQNESVYGILFEISEEDRAYFLNSEPGYEFVKVQIFTKRGSVDAYTFISKKTQEGIFPKEAYWKIIYQGGMENEIPSTYLSQILNRVGRTEPE